MQIFEWFHNILTMWWLDIVVNKSTYHDVLIVINDGYTSARIISMSYKFLLEKVEKSVFSPYFFIVKNNNKIDALLVKFDTKKTMWCISTAVER